MKRRFFGLMTIVLTLACIACRKANPQERTAERIAESESVYQTGYALMLERQYEKAADTFEKAIALDKTNAEAWYGLSSVLIELEKYGKAVDAALQAAKFYENATMYDDKIGFRNDALVQAGEAYLWNKKTKQAATQFQAVYDLDPENADVLQNIVATYIRCEYADEASMFCEKNTATYAKNMRAVTLLKEMQRFLQDEKDGTREATE